MSGPDILDWHVSRYDASETQVSVKVSFFFFFWLLINITLTGYEDYLISESALSVPFLCGHSSGCGSGGIN